MSVHKVGIDEPLPDDPEERETECKRRVDDLAKRLGTGPTIAEVADGFRRVGDLIRRNLSDGTKREDFRRLGVDPEQLSERYVADRTGPSEELRGFLQELPDDPSGVRELKAIARELRRQRNVRALENRVLDSRTPKGKIRSDDESAILAGKEVRNRY